MKENIIIEGKFTRKLFRVLLIVGGVLFSIVLIWCYFGRPEHGYSYQTRTHPVDFFTTLGECFIFDFDDFAVRNQEFVCVLLYAGLAFLVAALFVYLMSRCELTVTDKRVIGKANFGKRIDLPLNQISVISSTMFTGIAVATSSGKVSFWFLKNRDEVFSELSKIVQTYQIQKTDFSAQSTVVKEASDADELKKYKELLDAGAITQDEYNDLKKRLLGL